MVGSIHLELSQSIITSNLLSWEAAEAATDQRCSKKKMFLKISQNWQENACASISFIINFIKKDSEPLF